MATDQDTNASAKVEQSAPAGQRRARRFRVPRLLWLIGGGGAAALNGVHALRMLPADDGPPYVLMASVIVVAACFVTVLFLGMYQKVTLVDGVLAMQDGLGLRRQVRLDQVVAATRSSQALGLLARDERGRFRGVGLFVNSLAKSPSCEAIVAFLEERFGLEKMKVPWNVTFVARTIVRGSPAMGIWICLMIGSVVTFFAAASAANNRERFLMTLLIPPGVAALFPFFLALNILRRRRLLREGRFEKLGLVTPKP